MEGAGQGEASSSKPIRRYYCDFCGIGRSKRCLLKAHMLSQHKEEMESKERSTDHEPVSSTTCAECGASFRKPAYLKQHMLSHSPEEFLFLCDENHLKELDVCVKHWIPLKELQNAMGLNGLVSGWETSCEAPSSWLQSRTISFLRSFTCSVDDCHSCYKRKDHLTRHLLQHEGKLFLCPIENCNKKFAFQGNMTRHVKELHDENPSGSEGKKLHICQEPGCGKSFKYASKLRKHEESHVKLDSIEAVCCEPDCHKIFSNAECLKAHIRSCHSYVNCGFCGSRQLKKNIKRHLRVHDDELFTERIKCKYKDCCLTFSNKSNLNQHVKAVHLQLRPYKCRVSGCEERFSFRHVRDNHEKSAAHVYIEGDFAESDEQFRSRPRGGRKRVPVTVETLLRKRVVPPGEGSCLDNAAEYMSWLLSENR